MIPGRFFKVDYRVHDFSIFSYTSVVNTNDKNAFPIFLKLSSSYIAFYLCTQDIKVKKELPVNQLLFHIPIESQYGVEKPSQILKSIYHEEVDNNQITKRPFTNHDFLGYEEFDDPFNSEIIYKRKIFIDFLYDITHSEVFSKNAHINEIKKYIYTNFFINSIKSKCEFSFSRSEYIKFKSSLKPNSNYSEIKAFSTRLKEVEEKWLNVLFSEEANDFCFSHGWFEEVEKEIEGVVLNNLFDRKEWQEEFLNGVKQEQRENERNKFLRERIQIFDFYLSRYEFYQPYKWVSKTIYPLGFLGRFILNEKTLKVFVIVSICFFALNEISLLLIFIGAIGLSLGILSPIFHLCWDLLLRITDLCEEKYYQREESRIYYPSNHIKLSAPKMTISILVGWLAIFPFSEELWELNTKFSYSFYTYLIIMLTFIILSTIYYEIKLIEPIQNFWKSFIRVIRVFFIGISFSVGIGILLLHYSCYYMFDNKDFYTNDFIGQKAFTAIEKNSKEPKMLFDILQKIDKIDDEQSLIDSLATSIEYKKTDRFLRRNVDLLQCDTLNPFYKKKKKLGLDIRKEIDKLALAFPKKTEGIVITYSESIEKCKLPIIEYRNFLGLCNFFIFPRLLILNSLITFIIGFFIQFILEAKAYKQPL